jgi:hypothetical protein
MRWGLLGLLVAGIIAVAASAGWQTLLDGM